MPEMGGGTTNRVTSRDGTVIAIHTSGHGPPLVLVHGTSSDHTRWRPLLPHLEAHLTVHAMERRGRGLSGDGPEYGLLREFEDVAAVVRDVAAAHGAPVAVYGHSLGGLCALGAAVLGAGIRRLIVYEAPTSADPRAFPSSLTTDLEDRLAAGDRDGVVHAFLQQVVGLSGAEIDAFRGIPGWWEARTAIAHTIVREFVAGVDVGWPADVWSRVRLPTLFLVGAASDGGVRAETRRLAELLPDARIAELPGQAHLADVMAPELVAEQLLGFLLAHGGGPRR